MADDHVQFIGFALDASGSPTNIKSSNRVFSLAPKTDQGIDFEKLKEREDKKEDTPLETKSEGREKSTTGNELNKGLSELMDDFVSSIFSYRPLVALSGPVFKQIYSHTVLQNMLDTAKDRLVKIEEDDFEIIYGVPLSEYTETKIYLKQVWEFQHALDAIPGSTLLSLVATFDSFISQILRLMLLERPKLLTGDEGKISIQELLEMSSFDDAKDHFVSKKVDKLMRNSHFEQIRFIKENFVPDIHKYEKIFEFYEVFERRNLVAHGDCLVNKTYIRNLASLGQSVEHLEIGEKLKLSSEYLNRSLDVLTEFGILLIFFLWKHNCKEDMKKIYSQFSDLTYDFIKRGKYSLAKDLLQQAINAQSKDVPDVTIRMMIVNLANCYKYLEDDINCEKTLNSVDWSASTEDFHICVAALNGDFEKLLKFMDDNKLSNKVKKDNFRQWPVFNWVNEDQRFQEKYLEIYGEPFTEIIGEESDSGENLPGSVVAETIEDKSIPELH